MRARSEPGHIATVDGIRGLAILLIVFGHLILITEWAPPIKPLLAVRDGFHLGVDLMFLVSGFLLFLPVVADGGMSSVRGYAVRRLGRILPGYYLVLLVALALLPVLRGAHGLGDAPWPSPEVLASHLFFLEWQLHPGETGFRMVGSVWIICVILPFYALLPLIAGRYLRHPVLGLALGVGVAVCWRLAFAGKLPQVLSFTDDFAAGMTAAWLYIRLRRDHLQSARRFATPAAVACAAAALALMYVVGLPISRGEALRYAEAAWLSALLALVLAGFVLSTALAAHWIQAPFSNRAARWTGDVSYGVFLFHGPLTVLAMKLGFRHDGQTTSLLVLAMFVVPFSFLAGWLSLRFVERPLRRRAARLANRFETGEAMAAMPRAGGYP